MENIDLKTVASEINTILSNYGISEFISESDITCMRKFIWNNRLKRNGDNFTLETIPRLSKIIFNYYSPLPNTKETFYHYTTWNAFENIVKTKEIYLFNLLKRFSHGEYHSFYLDHDLKGYEKDDYFKDLMKDIYYISLARPKELTIDDEFDLETSFCNGEGIRLEFSINPHIPDFRNVYYNEGKKPLYQKLLEHIQNKYDKYFVVNGLSKLGAFYLQGDFSTEHETRLVIKKGTDDYSFDFEPIQSNGDIQYIKLKLEESNKYSDFHLKSIKAVHVNHDVINGLLEAYPFAEKPVIKE